MSKQELNDFYMLEPMYTPEEKLIRDSVREFVKLEILDNIGDWWQDGYFPPELPKKFGDLGVLGVTIPEKYGGLGASYTAYGLINRELEYGDSGMRSFVSVQSSLVMYPIYRYGSEKLRMKWLPRLVSGDAIGCFGLTEPDAGSDPGSMQTKVKKVGNDYVINGVKRWITNGSVADVAIIWARSEDDGRIHGFAVDTKTEGFSTVDIKTKVSLRASVTSELYLDDVVVKEEDKLESAIGLKAPLSCLNQARYGIAWGVLGAGFYSLEETSSYVQDRIIFGEPLASKQLIQSKLADILADLTKGSLLAFQLAKLKEKGKDIPARVSLAKRDNTRAAIRAAREARDILGANGITTEYGSIRHMLNLESVITYEGADSVHTLVLGQAITGIKAY
ncbi:MAG TPA: acyl-CoA dehydrogenase [Trueperaceae bacterium]|nr:acyl-CoA dehydrogenase [Trueperaceae bacterium]